MLEQVNGCIVSTESFVIQGILLLKHLFCRMLASFLDRSVYSHDRRVLSTPVGYSHDDQSEAR